MRDLRNILLAGLLPKLETVTGLKAYVRLPEKSATPPYIFVSEIYQSEDGPKTGFTYNIECKINIVYNDIKSNIQLYSKMDNVLSFVNNRKPFEITGFEIQACELISSFDEQSENPNGTTDSTGMIRLNFKIK